MSRWGMKKCAIVYNPNSGKKVKFNVMPQFEEMLHRYGYEVEIFYTEYKGHAIEIVKNLEHVDLVLSIGGDGTFNESITGNYARKDRLVCAHIPVGTTNDIGVMMGYGKNMLNNLIFFSNCILTCLLHFFLHYFKVFRCCITD